ncbi:MAG: hypothetical protein P4L65_10580 [Legionella sp.]|nr:hypothetical protein [Legionella sp.]
MAVNEEHFGDLYSDERVHDLLSPTAQKKFDEYQEQLTELSKTIHDLSPDSINNTPWKIWENGLRQIYKKMVFDAFDAFDLEIPPHMELHFSGSLAKAQATEYSDLDALVIVQNSDDVEKIRPVFEALNNLCQRIFTSTKQLYPDPIGINPSRLIGTVDELYNLLNDGNVANVEATVSSILTSKPILPHYQLGEALRAKIKANPEFTDFCSAEYFYHTAVNDFTAPQDQSAVINIKKHVMRPIDFMLMGLREEFNLYNEDGSHLSAPGTISLLREQKLLPEENIALIESVYNRAMLKRFDLHAQSKQEEDEMSYSDAQEMLDNVAQLRELAAARIIALHSPSKAEQPQKTGSFFSRHANILKAISLLALILIAGAAVGVGLVFGGGFAIPLAAAAAGMVVGTALLGYGLIKAAQALGNWIISKNEKPKEEVSPHAPEVRGSYADSMSRLGQNAAAHNNAEPDHSAEPVAPAHHSDVLAFHRADDEVEPTVSPTFSKNH